MPGSTHTPYLASQVCVPMTQGCSGVGNAVGDTVGCGVGDAVGIGVGAGVGAVSGDKCMDDDKNYQKENDGGKAMNKDE